MWHSQAVDHRPRRYSPTCRGASTSACSWILSGEIEVEAAGSGDLPADLVRPGISQGLVRAVDHDCGCVCGLVMSVPGDFLFRAKSRLDPIVFIVLPIAALNR